jgi:hypothetical protein
MALLACALAVGGAFRLTQAPAQGAGEILAAALLGAGLVRWTRMRGRLRLLAVLDAYAEREIEQARRPLWPVRPV